MTKPAYTSYCAMKARCLNKLNPRYKDYGGRGITICPEWVDSFETFLRDMGERPFGTTLGRIDNDGPYCKDNCRWETAEQQYRNMRTTVFIEYAGKRQSLMDWADETGIKPRTIYSRLRRGSPLEQVFAAKALPTNKRRVSPEHRAFMRRTANIFNRMEERARKAGATLDFALDGLRRKANPAVYTSCFFCGEPLQPQNLSADHAIPISRDGGWGLDNLIFVCDADNRCKGRMTAVEYRELLNVLDDMVPAAKADVLGRLKLAGSALRSRFLRK